MGYISFWLSRSWKKQTTLFLERDSGRVRFFLFQKLDSHLRRTGRGSEDRRSPPFSSSLSSSFSCFGSCVSIFQRDHHARLCFSNRSSFSVSEIDVIERERDRQAVLASLSQVFIKVASLSSPSPKESVSRRLRLLRSKQRRRRSAEELRPQEEEENTRSCLSLSVFLASRLYTFFPVCL